MDETKPTQSRNKAQPMTFPPRNVLFTWCISLIAFLSVERVASQQIVSLAPDIPATQCVLAVGASDINGNEEVDRSEFNQVILEVLSGCTLHEETISDWNAIFEELACLCQDYDDATCCTVGPTVMRPGRYPSEYTFRMCELLEDAVASQCFVFTPTSAPALGIVRAPTMAPVDIAEDSSGSSSRSRLLIVMIALLSFVILLVLCLCCTVCYWRWLHLRRVDELGNDEYEGQTFANTVAKGTLGAGEGDILLDMESQVSQIENSPSMEETEDERPPDIPEEIVSSSGDSGPEQACSYVLSIDAGADTDKQGQTSQNNDVSLENDSGWEDFDSGSSTDAEYIGEVDTSAEEERLEGDISGSIDGPNIYDSTSSDNDGATDDGNAADQPTQDESAIAYERLDEDPEDIISNPEFLKNGEYSV